MSYFPNSRRFTSLLPILGLAIGCKGSDVQVATYNTDPLATIQEPGTGEVAAQGEGVNFRGLVQDGEDDLETLLVTWTSDLDGVIYDEPADSSGATVFNTANLSAGSHAITLEVIDSGSLSARDSITITIDAVADAPMIQIRSPEISDTGVQFEEFNFEALVSDNQDAPEDLKIAFSSDLDGVFCEPTAFGLSETSGLADCDAVLNPGAHVLEFTVMDTDGNEGKASIGFVVASCPSWYADADFDGYGASSTAVVTCDPSAGWVNAGGDCDDQNKVVNPGAVESPGDSVDQNCDGGELCYVDGDGDGFRNPANTLTSADTDCTDVGEFAATAPLDCNDADITVKPGANDLPDDANVDTNCDSVDGDIAHAVFVAPAPTGNDGFSGLTPSEPVATLNRAVTVAGLVTGRDQILIRDGTYSTSAAIGLVSGDSWYGGYGTGFTSRSATNPVLQATSSTAVTFAAGTAATVIDRVDVWTLDQSAGSPTTTIRVVDSASHLTIRNLLIHAGRGGDGLAGTTPGASTGTGGVGANGSGNSGLTGGNGGGGGSGSGGAGGRGGNEGSAGSGGANGGTNSSSGGLGGAGGSGGTGCNDGDPGDGANGRDGVGGSTGGNGTGANGIGTFSSATWTAVNGLAGGAGGRGGGGGGGGGGAGEGCYIWLVYEGHEEGGKGAGGGGGGGEGGQGGGFGGGGGASIGLGIHNSTVAMHNARVETAGGGTGGAGAGGGAGASGGAGGNGIVGSSDSGSSGRGGTGGTGGTGGCGSGGAGGPSVGIWGSGSATVRVTGTYNISTGNQGAGGSNCGSPAIGGTKDDTRSVTVQ